MSNLNEEYREVQIPFEKYWYTAKEACELKGVSYNTLRKPQYRHLLPNYGQGTVVVDCGKHRQMFSVDEIADWLPKSQEEIENEMVGNASAFRVNFN